MHDIWKCIDCNDFRIHQFNHSFGPFVVLELWNSINNMHVSHNFSVDILYYFSQTNRITANSFIIDHIKEMQKELDKEFWNKVAEELKPTIKRALEETFEDSERNDILQKRLEDYPWKKEQKCECYTCIYAPNKECGWYAACNNCIEGSNYWRKSDE